LDSVQPHHLRSSHPDFGELVLPLGGAPSLRPAALAHPVDPEEADIFGDGELAPQARARSVPPQARPAAEAVVRQSGGGTAYGEVNLGDEGSEAEVPLEAGPRLGARRDEDMEFGAIPQEDQPRATPGGAAQAPVASSVGRAAPPTLKQKRKLDLRLFGGVFVVFVAGAALSLVPALGPFGAYLLIDQDTLRCERLDT